jgi:hypothetical protein
MHGVRRHTRNQFESFKVPGKQRFVEILPQTKFSIAESVIGDLLRTVIHQQIFDVSGRPQQRVKKLQCVIHVDKNRGVVVRQTQPVEIE